LGFRTIESFDSSLKDPVEGGERDWSCLGMICLANGNGGKGRGCSRGNGVRGRGPASGFEEALGRCIYLRVSGVAIASVET
jgi:hypothetical protein